MKYKYLTLALVLLFPVVLTACSLADLPLIGKYFAKTGGDDTNANKPAVLDFWGLWEDPRVIDVLKAKYQENKPNITISYDDRSILKPVEYKERVFERFTQSTGPDVAMVHVSWVPRIKGMLQPMPDNMMSVNDFSNNYYPSAAASLVLDNKIYGIPAYYDGIVLLYNKTHFAKIGQTRPPTAWEEFRRLAVALTDEEAGIKGAAIGAADNITFFADILGMLFSQAGVPIPDGVDSKPAWDAMSFYTNFVKVDKVWDPTTTTDDLTLFGQGKVSMVFVPSWAILYILQNNPDIQFGVSVPPQAIPSSPATWASYWVYVVPKSAENAKASWEFVHYLGSEEAEQILFSEGSKVRPYGSPYALKKLKSQVSMNPYISPVLESAEYGKSYELSSRSGNRRQEEALRAAVNAVLAGSEAKAVMGSVKAELSK